jgi:polyhydroxyalkanoate synthesis regulator phasin
MLVNLQKEKSELENKIEILKKKIKKLENEYKQS